MPGYWHMGNSHVAGSITGDLCHVALYNRPLRLDQIVAHFTAAPDEPEPEPPDPELPPMDGGPMREAWLVLGERVRPLNDPASDGSAPSLTWAASTLDEVVNNAPDRHGQLDRTTLLGGRVVTASITAVPDGDVRLDAIDQRVHAVHGPRRSPELHYTLLDDIGERTLELRASQFASPMPRTVRRELQLSWTAPDPLARFDGGAHRSSGGRFGGVVGRSYP